MARKQRPRRTSHGFYTQPIDRSGSQPVGVPDANLDVWSNADDARFVLATYNAMQALKNAFPWEKLRPQLATTFAAGDIEAAIGEFKRFLGIKVVGKDWALTNGATRFSPSREVDAVWHAAMLCPLDYFNICNRVCGEVIDHNPAGQGDPVDQRMERYTKTVQMYEKMFLEKPSKKFWSDDDLLNNSGSMELFVKFLSGTILTVRASPHDSIELLVQRILLVGELIPEMELRLFFAGRQMEPDRTLAEYNIQNKTTVHAMEMLSGC